MSYLAYKYTDEYITSRVKAIANGLRSRANKANFASAVKNSQTPNHVYKGFNISHIMKMYTPRTKGYESAFKEFAVELAEKELREPEDVPAKATIAQRFAEILEQQYDITLSPKLPNGSVNNGFPKPSVNRSNNRNNSVCNERTGSCGIQGGSTRRNRRARRTRRIRRY
jgi:hypothetical protein